MLRHPILDKLYALRLSSMAKALETQWQTPAIHAIAFEERLGLLVDHEWTARENQRLKNRLKKASLRESAACPEDINYQAARGLDKALLAKLVTCQWIHEHYNCLIIGSTGVGKTYLGCALAQKACREGYSACYLRLPKFFRELSIAKGDGRYLKLLKAFAKTDLLILDDLGLSPLTDEQRRDLLEILEERYQRRSTLITSQFPTDHWHQLIGDPTLADAILDRVVHNAYKLDLAGESMRKNQKKLTRTTTPNS
jgi:DNA replication protein DnaC